MKKKLKIILILIPIIILCFSALFYLNLRHNYVAMMSSLNSCREVASALNTDIRIESEYDMLMGGYGKFCFMDGDPESYNWYLSHPFSRIVVKEGVDGYSAKITGSFIDTFF